MRFIDEVTPAALAGVLGVSRQTIHNWRNGRHGPSVDMTKKLIDLAGGQLKRADIRPDIYGE